MVVCMTDIIQLLTIEALDMMWYRPESTNIDRGGAEVNIGILRSISHHVQCLNSQQLFYFIISLNKKKQQQQQNLGFGLCLGQSWISLFYMMTNRFHSVKRGMNAYFICNYNCRQKFHQGLHCLLRQKWSPGKKLQYCLEIKTCDPLNYTMDHSSLLRQSRRKNSLVYLRVLLILYSTANSEIHVYDKTWNLVNFMLLSLTELYLQKIMQVSCWKHTCYGKFPFVYF